MEATATDVEMRSRQERTGVRFGLTHRSHV